MFANRVEAGRQLARALAHLAEDDVVVLGLPRGGVPVAAEVARALRAPLDVIVVRKLGVPAQPELAMGAIGEGGVRVVNDEIVQLARIGDVALGAVERAERAELVRRAERFRPGHTRVDVHGRVAVVVDDGIATGSTARAACEVARAQGASRIVLAVPVAPADWTRRLGDVADEFVCLHSPREFRAVGQFYDDFGQTSDAEVMACLRDAAAAESADNRQTVDEEVMIDTPGATLVGHLTVPVGASGLVVFAHGSGSSRHSPRNRVVAEVLNDRGVATLLLDLLTEVEEHDRGNVFDIELLAGRLVAVVGWVRSVPILADLPIGYFGASTGAGAALRAAAEPAVDVAAVVSRGGRPDLAGDRLPDVRAPTLLVVGDRDRVVLDLNRQALDRLRCEARLATVPGATHLFEEPGTLQVAAELACDWFVEHLRGPAGRPPPTDGTGNEPARRSWLRRRRAP
jgi:putative phosphoribosyl transferase